MRPGCRWFGLLLIFSIAGIFASRSIPWTLSLEDCSSSFENRRTTKCDHPLEKHWHGATATTGMTLIAIVEKTDVKTAGWMEQLTDEQ